MADGQDVYIRNVDRAVWQAVRIEALKRRVPVGQLVTEILRAWLDQRQGREEAIR